MIRLYGDGGHAKVIKDILRVTGKGFMVVTSILPQLPEGPKISDGHWIVAIGANGKRKSAASALAAAGAKFTLAIHPSVIESLDVAIGEGTVIMAGAIIQPGCRIGRHVIVNTGATLDHDCVIGDFVHIGPGCTLCGDVHVSEGKMVPAGTVLYQGARW